MLKNEYCFGKIEIDLMENMTGMKMFTERKIEAISKAAYNILSGDIEAARMEIKGSYEFKPFVPKTRNYTDKQKLIQFCRDGFIDRYSGQKLINSGLLRTISTYIPDEFPFQKNWKMSECHIAYWEFVPTLDHIVPIALGGVDAESNWATTSMMHNHIKNNWTLEQLNWHLCSPGDINEWDGLTSQFIELVNTNTDLLNDNYIKNWYRLSKKALQDVNKK